MRSGILTAVGVVLTIAGVIWALQGFGVIGGSFMSGDSVWAIIGPIVAAVGLVLSVIGVRRARSASLARPASQERDLRLGNATCGLDQVPALQVVQRYPAGQYRQPEGDGPEQQHGRDRRSGRQPGTNQRDGQRGLNGPDTARCRDERARGVRGATEDVDARKLHVGGADRPEPRR